MTKKNHDLPEWLTQYMESHRARFIEAMPSDLTKKAKELYEKAVSKFAFVLTDRHEWALTYENLTDNERFALGITGTDAWPLYTPKAVEEKLKAIQLRIENSNLSGATVFYPNLDLDQINRVRDLERKSILVTEHGEKFKSPEPGSLSTQAEHIHNLVRDNRTLTAKELQQIANIEIIGEMGRDAFREHVTKARKQYPKRK